MAFRLGDLINAVTGRAVKGAGPQRRSTRPGTGSLHPIAIRAAGEATKLLDHVGTHAKLFGRLPDSQFLFFLELYRRNFITPTDPVNRLSRKGTSLRSTVAFSIELFSDFVPSSDGAPTHAFGRPPRSKPIGKS
jgi:hypothetical protein